MVAGLLDGPRARGAFLLRSSMDPPWALSVQDEAPLTVVAVIRGHAVLTLGGGQPTRLGPGDLAVVRGPGHYVIGDAERTAPQAVIGPDQRCTAVDGSEVSMTGQGIRTWGNSPDGATVLLTGTYPSHGEVGARLLNALPALLVIPAPSWDNPLPDYLAQEVSRDDPGQGAVLDRLLDVLLVAALRWWFDRPEAQPPGWYAAHGDPVIGPALRLLQHQPGDPWTVGSLARAVGVSRAVLARRFSDLVGEPPMTFLTGWRLDLAADLLAEPGVTLTAVARQVGYGSPFALSNAFKRERGIAPTHYRDRLRA